MLSRAVFVMVLIMSTIVTALGQDTGSEPWKEHQLMPPAILAQLINDSSARQPVILSIGTGALIKGSIDMGEAKNPAQLNNLEFQLSKLSRDTAIVIYCGCCPFQHCPNIRPAFDLLNKMKFVNHKLLHLPKNIKADWINNGYPLNQ
jgi:thiosulfate/3-mercaptopyruvate sulfurtransferase